MISQLNKFCVLTRAESERRFSQRKIYLSPLLPSPAFRSVVDSLFIVASIVCLGCVFGPCFVMQYFVSFFYTPPQTMFVVGILFSRCPSVRPSVTFCFLNNSKSHCWIFIKPCKHVHICKTNTLDKKARARGQFY